MVNATIGKDSSLFPQPMQKGKAPLLHHKSTIDCVLATSHIGRIVGQKEQGDGCGLVGCAGTSEGDLPDHELLETLFRLIR